MEKLPKEITQFLESSNGKRANDCETQKQSNKQKPNKQRGIKMEKLPKEITQFLESSNGKRANNCETQE